MPEQVNATSSVAVPALKTDVVADSLTVTPKSIPNNVAAPNSGPSTPIDNDQYRPLSTGPDAEHNRGKTNEPEHVVEWSPNGRYGKVPLCCLIFTAQQNTRERSLQGSLEGNR